MNFVNEREYEVKISELLAAVRHNAQCLSNIGEASTLSVSNALKLASQLNEALFLQERLNTAKQMKAAKK